MSEEQHSQSAYAKQPLAISDIAEPMAQVSEAKALLVTEQYTQAEYLLEVATQENPDHCDAWHALGHARRLQGKLDGAMEAYSKAIDIAYRYHSVIHYECSAQYLRRALLRFETGEQDKAMQDIEQAVFQDHGNQAALAIQQQGWRRGMELPEYNHNLMTEIGWEQEIRRMDGYEFADLLPFQQAHDKAIYYWRHGQHEHAIGVMSEMLKQRKDYPMAWHHRALMFLDLGDTRQAISDLDHALDAAKIWHDHYHRDAALHHYHRGQIYHQQGQTEMAMMDYSKAHDINKNFPEVMAAQAFIRADMGQIPTAIAEIEQAIALMPNPEWEVKRDEWSKQVYG